MPDGQAWQLTPAASIWVIHHEIGEASFFLDIIGKITRKIVGLYVETKLDKLCIIMSKLASKDKTLQKDHNSGDDISFLGQMVTGQPVNPLPT